MFQDLASFKDFVVKKFKQNASLSGCFKAVRRESGNNLIADYPLLTYIMMIALELEIKWNRDQVMRAMSYGDFKEEGSQRNYIYKDWEKFVKA